MGKKQCIGQNCVSCAMGKVCDELNSRGNVFFTGVVSLFSIVKSALGRCGGSFYSAGAGRTRKRKMPDQAGNLNHIHNTEVKFTVERCLVCWTIAVEMHICTIIEARTVRNFTTWLFRHFLSRKHLTALPINTSIPMHFLRFVA